MYLYKKQERSLTNLILGHFVFMREMYCGHKQIDISTLHPNVVDVLRYYTRYKVLAAASPAMEGEDEGLLGFVVRKVSLQ